MVEARAAGPLRSRAVDDMTIKSQQRHAIALRGIWLVAGSADETTLIPSFALIAGASGLTLAGPDGRITRHWRWTDVDGFRAEDSAQGPGGSALQVLDVVTTGEHLQFLAPAPDLSVFFGAVTRILPERSGILTPALALARLRRALAPIVLVALQWISSTPLARSALAWWRVAADWSLCVSSSWQKASSLGSAWFHSVLGKLPIIPTLLASHPRIDRRHRVLVTTAGLAALMLAGATAASGYAGSLRVAPASSAVPARARHGQPRQRDVLTVLAMDHLIASFAGSRDKTIHLPPASQAPQPEPPSLADAAPLQPHEIFAFAPYWPLPYSTTFDVAGMTTLAYFGLDVNGNGTIRQSGSGWDGYQSQDLVNLIDRAHAAGDRVVLTATCFDQAALDQLTSDPSAAARLGPALAGLIAAKNLDGVNLDFEGAGSADRTGLDKLVAQVSARLHAADPHWQVTMDTYASSAGDPNGFFDIAGLAPSVNAFFVMAYDMNDPTVPSPTSPLGGSGFTDMKAVEQYAAVVPASKVILGVPYYGYQWPTTGPNLGDPATGPPLPVSYSQVAAESHLAYWDPATQTPWTSYQVGGQWYQTFYDDPTSLALKADLAGFFHLRGLGIWALGMGGGDPALLAALLGHAPPAKTFQPSPEPAAGSSGLTAGATGATTPPTLPLTTTTLPTTTTTVPATPDGQSTPGDYSFTGMFDGTTVILLPADRGTLPPTTPVAERLGELRTTDPSEACLASGPGLTVSEVTGSPGIYVATASLPADCASGTWAFLGPPTTARAAARAAGAGATSTLNAAAVRGRSSPT